jgi:murein DD-endopeptidase MepM/ murein hydrolase activator NlpD
MVHGSRFTVYGLLFISLFIVHCSLFTDFAFTAYEEKIKEYDKKIQEKEKEKTKAKKKLTTEKKELEKKRIQERNLRIKLDKIKKDLEVKKKEIIIYDKNLKKTKKKLEKKEEDLGKATENLRTSQGTLGERLIIIYKRKSLPYPHNFSQKILQKKSMNIIASCDADELTGDEEKKKGIEREKKSLEEKRTRIATYKETASKKKGEIEKNKKVKETLLTKTEKERIAYQKRVRKLEKASKELEALIRSLEIKKRETIEQARLASLAFRQKKRRLPWPTISYQVTKTYGKHQHPQYKTYTFHKGIDIKAPQGAEVWAVSKGSIVFAQWSQKPGLREYGKMVMIAHGGGYYTLYAHLDSILVKENQEVEGGQLIGKVGQTASKKGSYLYFEIRKDGAPLNPLHWLRK